MISLISARCPGAPAALTPPHVWPELPSAEKPDGVVFRAKSKLLKKNALFLMIGPPALNPACLSLKAPTFVSAGLGTAGVANAGIAPIRSWLRANQYPVPEKRLLPLLVTAFMEPPEKPPCRTS